MTFVWSDATSIDSMCNYECLGRIDQCVKELAVYNFLLQDLYSLRLLTYEIAYRD